jgi:hypothetical protein
MRRSGYVPPSRPGERGVPEAALGRSWLQGMAKQFESFRASELHCATCRTLRPVRERLLLVLPRAEVHEYRCVICGGSLGTREVRQQAVGIVVPR